MPGIFVQVVAATCLGVLTGLFLPHLAGQCRWLADLFLRLILMAVGPLLFCIVVTGITGTGSLGAVGRLGLRALIYFEVMTTLVLFLSLGAALLIEPGRGLPFAPTAEDAHMVSSYAGNASLLHGQGVTGFILSVIPRSPVAAFAEGNILQILFFAILIGCCLSHIGEAGAPVTRLIDSLSVVFSRMMRIIIATAPLGVFGAVAATIAQYGLDAIAHLASFVVLYFLAIAIFIVVILGGCLFLCGVQPLRFARYFREELLIVTATTSSDSVLPSIMAKLETMGVSRQVVGLVVPAGYSLNLDALSIYLGFAVVFLANVTGTHLTAMQMLSMLATALITSKGAHGVPGIAIVVLAATLAAAPSIPVSSLVLLLAVDWFIGIARAVGNLAGNCVAPVVIAAWNGSLDREQARAALAPSPKAGL
ncbi:cation:dicarboxylate symporter family transporter [Acetobacter sp.]|jgi:DAACS family dicarboxylate/amino acid:cation (Na+ or H+) symporter/aerobic C4-dicarboxylate transport protein|uniref:cation:dicarboxylate symporter family transporter n=1 Tax=Acetobacter sp. TaxID=440 RepID=UPI0025BC5DA0|nr:cation:dicarboxylase symporter family transporter [Acetobacter sp.]MCH4091530.1 cation:dicarboxylase symporter family transporter [Acetobacter sp.]MCI1299508.1 cation:dicarboxylase symporter family transporter [Acetobacter sp.]MCI1316902.1 cation:dicarboxylase symporter family transporter [Acetobacter sp.]